MLENDWPITRKLTPGPDNFAHILTSFPVLARKRPAFHAYLRARLADWQAGAQV